MSPVPPVPAAGTDPGIRRRLAALVHAVGTHADADTDGSGAEDEQLDPVLAGLDSLAVVRLLVLVEQEFGIALAGRHIVRENFRSLSALSALVETHLRPRGPVPGVGR
ncbi:phosphopantetheine-binding protein [Streptomyces sp. NPDC056670]|uniref:phosphopantetheine-binding protein n=1 Tax=Streptomyces sp. NPDC056670 TaxID=3345904 RepID=UPI0036BA5BE6